MQLEPALIRKWQKLNLSYQTSKRRQTVGRILGSSHIWGNNVQCQKWVSKIYGLPFSVLPLSECWLHFLNQLSSMARVRFGGSFKAHIFPVSYQSHRGASVSTPNKIFIGLSLSCEGSLEPITNGEWGLTALGHMLIV